MLVKSSDAKSLFKSLNVSHNSLQENVHAQNEKSTTSFKRLASAKDVFEAVRGKCIRVYDIHDAFHVIDISSSLEPASVREKVMLKFGLFQGSCSELNDLGKHLDEYALYIRSKAFPSSQFIRDTSIDDLTLTEILSNPDHPYRGNLVIEKRRHPKMKSKGFEVANEARLANNNNSKLNHKIYDYLGKEPEKPAATSSDTSEALDLMSTTRKKKLSSFFGEEDVGATPLKPSKYTKSRKQKQGIAALKKDISGPLNGRKMKIQSFFGERPPQDLIAQNLSIFFPGLGDDEFPEMRESLMQRRKSSLAAIGKLTEKKNQLPAIGETSTDLKQRKARPKGLILSRSQANLLLKEMPEAGRRQSQSELSFRSKSSDQLARGTATSKEISNLSKSLDLISSHNSFSNYSRKKSQISRASSKSSIQSFTKLSTTKSGEILVKALESRHATGSFPGNINLQSNSLLLKSLDNSMVQKDSQQEFFKVFATLPDLQKKLKWIQGPLIGKGSFGKVFYGANCETHEIMAVKQVSILNRGQNTRKILESLHIEISLLKDLRHVNIVRYIGYYIEADVINIFLEYVSGGSISSALSIMGPFDEVLVKSLVNQILDGLDYLHKSLVIHRDIKGANILLDDDGLVKISDFGISKRNKYELAYKTNSNMSIQGTVYWMAPEVIKGGKKYSAKVDIWSLGCLLVEMITASHPWKGLDDIQTLWRLGRFESPKIPENLSAGGRDFIEKTFTINPDNRPTCDELLQHSFCIYDKENFDFRSYKEAAILRKKELDEQEIFDIDSESRSASDVAEESEDEEDISESGSMTANNFSGYKAPPAEIPNHSVLTQSAPDLTKGDLGTALNMRFEKDQSPQMDQNNQPNPYAR